MNFIFELLNYSLHAKCIVLKIQMKAYQSIKLTRALNEWCRKILHLIESSTFTIQFATSQTCNFIWTVH